MILLRGGAEHLRSSASGQTALDFARTEEVPGSLGPWSSPEKRGVGFIPKGYSP